MELVFIITLITCCICTYLLTCKSIFDAPGIFILHILGLALPPALLHWGGFSFSGAYYDVINESNALIQLSLITLVSFVATNIGFLVFRKLPAGQFLFPDYKYNHSDIVFMVGVAILTLLSFAVIIVPLATFGFDFFLTADAIRHGRFFQGAAALRQFQFFAFFLSGAFLVHVLLKRKKQLPVHRHMFAITLLLFCMNFFQSLILGGKTFVIFPLAFTLLAYQICVRKHSLVKFFMIVGFLISLIVSLQFIRSEVVQHVEKPIDEHVYVGLYFILYDSTLVYLDTDNDLHHTSLGQDFVTGLSALVPRAIWKNKPTEGITLGSRFKDQITNYQGQGGWPVYGFAQWYINFGWAGVVIGGLLTGLFLAILNKRYEDYRDNPFSLMILWASIILVMGPWPGGFHSFTPMHYVLYILPLHIFKLLSKKNLYEPKSSARTPAN